MVLLIFFEHDFVPEVVCFWGQEIWLGFSMYHQVARERISVSSSAEVEIITVICESNYKDRVR